MEKSYQGSVVAKEGIIHSFLFPSSYTLNKVFIDASVEEMLMAFSITQQVISTKDKLCLDGYASTIVKANTERQESLMEALRQTTMEEKKKLTQQHESEMLVLKKQIATLEISLRELKASEDIIKERYQEQADKRVNDINIVSEKLLSSQKDFTEKWERECERLRNENKELQQQIQARNILQQNSSKKGRFGEQTFESIAKEIKGWTLNYTGDESHSGDYHATIQNASVMFEIKGHDIPTIPGKEIEKFRNDMRTHSSIDIGVFVALNSKIPYMQDITIERSPTNQYLIFIPLFLQQDLPILFNFLDIVFQIVMVYRTLLTKTNTVDESSLLKEQIHRATHYTQNILTRVTTTVKNFTEDARILQDKLDTLSSHIRTNMAAQVEDVKSLLSILSGQDVEAVVTEVSDGTPMELPAVHGEVKKKRRAAVKSKKITECLQ